MKWYCVNHEEKKIDEYDSLEWGKFSVFNSVPLMLAFTQKDGTTSRGYNKEDIFLESERKKAFRKLKEYLDRLDSFKFMSKVKTEDYQ